MIWADLHNRETTPLQRWTAILQATEPKRNEEVQLREQIFAKSKKNSQSSQGCLIFIVAIGLILLVYLVA
jgi:hypothetical protein